MLAFIDDSGDPGFKLDCGSTRFFIIAVIIFNDPLEAEKTAIAIKDLKRELGFPDSMEFKFFKTKPAIRKKFLQKVAPFQFNIRCIIFDKTLLTSHELRNNKNSFYSYAIKMVLKHSRNSIKDAKIKIDGSGDRTFRKSFQAYLRQQLNSGQQKIMLHCKLVDSKENVLIQLADMVAGTIKRSYDRDKKDGKELKAIIQKNIQDEWSFK